MVNRRGTLSYWQHFHVNPVVCVCVCCSIVLHPHVYCSLKYFSSASPASQVLPICFLHLLVCCPFCLWFCQPSSEGHHSTSQSKLLCLFLGFPSAPCRYVSSWVLVSVFLAQGMTCSVVRLDNSSVFCALSDSITT